MPTPAESAIEGAITPDDAEAIRRARHRPRTGHHRSIVELHGRRVDVAGDLGSGSAFTVCLPTEHPDAAGAVHRTAPT